MATPPPSKRTRLSLLPEISQRSQTAPATPAGIRAPPRRGSQTPKSAVQGTPASARRASYLSPTKASLARYNPRLLPEQPRTRGSLGSPRRPKSSDGLARVRDGNAARALPYGKDRNGVLSSGTATAMKETTRLQEISRETSDERAGAGQVVKDPGIAVEQSIENIVGKSLPAALALPKHPRQARIIKPPSNIASSPTRVVALEPDHEDEDGDDDLPETPIAMRIAMAADDAPPRGILFSTPAKRKRKSMGMPSTLGSDATSIPAEERRLQKRTRTTPPAPEPVDELSPEAEEPPAVREQPAKKNQLPSARPGPEDPAIVTKRRETETLQRELDELRASIQQLEDEAAKGPEADAAPLM